MSWIREDTIGPVCRGWCDHDSCHWIAIPELYLRWDGKPLLHLEMV